MGRAATGTMRTMGTPMPPRLGHGPCGLQTLLPLLDQTELLAQSSSPGREPSAPHCHGQPVWQYPCPRPQKFSSYMGHRARLAKEG